MTTIRCRLLLFAGVAESVGARDLVITLPEGSTVTAVFEALAATSPAGAESVRLWRSSAALAVNERFVDRGTRLTDGDVVAIMPPASGG